MADPPLSQAGVEGSEALGLPGNIRVESCKISQLESRPGVRSPPLFIVKTRHSQLVEPELGIEYRSSAGIGILRIIRGSDSHSHFTHRSEEHTSELQSRGHLVCHLLLEKKKNNATRHTL